jgi:hypothetical protein
MKIIIKPMKAVVMVALALSAALGFPPEVRNLNPPIIINIKSTKPTIGKT